MACSARREMVWKSAWGASWITMGAAMGRLEKLPPPSEEWDSITSYRPGFTYACVGFGWLEKLPSPKFHRWMPSSGRVPRSKVIGMPGQASVTEAVAPLGAMVVVWGFSAGRSGPLEAALGRTSGVRAAWR